jgi:hypothetical protein
MILPLITHNTNETKLGAFKWKAHPFKYVLLNILDYTEKKHKKSI